MNSEAKPDTKILIVDDDEDACEVTKMGLELEGFQAESAPDGRTAMEVIERYAPDLVILDLMMPVMDGLRFLRWLRNERGDTTTKVIIHTGVVSNDIQKEGIDAGASLVVQKPRQLVDLVNAINRVLCE